MQQIKGVADLNFAFNYTMHRVPGKQSPQHSVQNFHKLGLRVFFLNFIANHSDTFYNAYCIILHINDHFPTEAGLIFRLNRGVLKQNVFLDTDLLFIITSTADDLSGGTNIDDFERPRNPKIVGFSEFFAISGCEAHLKSEFSPKLLETDQDSLRMKLN